jgi:hypothetical protein
MKTLKWLSGKGSKGKDEVMRLGLGLSLFFIFSGNVVHSQQTCQTAIQISPASGQQMGTLGIGIEHWATFQGLSDPLVLDFSYVNLLKVVLYSSPNGCSSLTPVDSVELSGFTSVPLPALNPTLNYFFKFSSGVSRQGDIFNYQLRNNVSCVTLSTFACETVQHQCCCIQQASLPPVNPCPGVCNITTNFTNGCNFSMCVGQSYWLNAEGACFLGGPPFGNVNFTVTGPNGYNQVITNNNPFTLIEEGMYQITYGTNGYVWNIHAVLCEESKPIEVNCDQICLNTCEIPAAPSQGDIDLYDENNNLVSTIYYSQHGTYCFDDLTVGTYTVTVLPNIFTQTVTIYPPILPVIEGPSSVCCTSTPNQYCVTNASDFVSFAWQAGNGVQILGPSNLLCVNVSGNLGIVTVTAVDVNGCESFASFDIGGCCTPASIVNTADVVTDECNPTTLSSLNLPNPVSFTTFLLQNDLYIDVDVDIDHCVFYVEPGFSIILNDGIEVNSSKNLYRNSCNEMWQGIVLSNNSRWNSNGGDKYTQAITALEVRTGAEFSVASADFESNYVGMFINEHPFPQTLAEMSVKQTNFYTAAPLLPPYAGQPGFRGIQIRDVREIRIGTQWSEKNTFSNLRFGLHITRSSVYVTGNEFKDMALGESTGIYAGATVSDIPYFLVIGDIDFLFTQDPLFRNEFDNMRIGVEVFGRYNLVAIGNEFRRMNQRGILCIQKRVLPCFLTTTSKTSPPAPFRLYPKAWP